MVKYFVDTSAWIAFFDQDDKFHTSAVDFIKRKERILITSNIVLHETIAVLTRRISKKVATKAGRFIFDEELTTCHVISNQQEQQAWNYFVNKKTPLSFVDWSSKVVMDDEGLKDIFTFDSGFDAVGLKRIP